MALTRSEDVGGSTTPSPKKKKAKKRRASQPQNKAAAERSTYGAGRQEKPARRKGKSDRDKMARVLKEIDRQEKPTGPKLGRDDFIGPTLEDVPEHARDFRGNDTGQPFQGDLADSFSRSQPRRSSKPGVGGPSNKAAAERGTYGFQPSPDTTDLIRGQQFEDASESRGAALEDYYRENYAWLRNPDGSEDFVRVTPGSQELRGVWETGTSPYATVEDKDGLAVLGRRQQDAAKVAARNKQFQTAREQAGLVYFGKRGGVDSYRQFEDVQRDIFRMTPDEVKELQKDLGLPDTGYPDVRTIQYWEMLVKTSAYYTSVGNNHSPGRLLAMWAELHGTRGSGRGGRGGGRSGGSGGSGGGSGGSGAAVARSQVKSLANRVAQEELGREASKEEVDALLPLIRSAVANGRDPEQVATDFFRGDDEDEVDALATAEYFEAIQGVLGGGGAGAEAEQ